MISDAKRTVTMTKKQESGNMTPSKLPERFWKLASAGSALSKANWACVQTGELGRKKTIISVDEDEAFALYMALDEYIKKHRKEYEDDR